MVQMLLQTNKSHKHLNFDDKFDLEGQGQVTSSNSSETFK